MSDGMEERMQNVEKLLVRIDEKLDKALSDIKDHENRLRSLEGKDGKKWNSITTEVIKWLVIGGLGTYLITKIQIGG
jgi:septal ring factor EnvC (AmiA/AmiB activator)